MSRSLGQGHLLENVNFATWTSVLTWFDLSEVKVINEVKSYKVIESRSRSFHGKC